MLKPFVFLLLACAAAIMVPSARAQQTPSPTPEYKGDRFKGPKLLKHPTPGYPELAHLNREEGVIGVRFAIDETGRVTSVSVVRHAASLLLDDLARDRALAEWTFEPATFDGKPVPSSYDKEFEFRLNPVEERVLAEKRLAAPVGTPDPPYPPEALRLKERPKGSCTVGVSWTKLGLVDKIRLVKASGSNTLDNAALRFAYTNWRVDPAKLTNKDASFEKTVTFTPPSAP